MTDADFYRRVAQADGIDPELRQEAMRRLRQQWQPSGTFTAGQATTPALAVGWLVLAGHQMRLQPPRASELYPDAKRPDRALTEAMRRAATHVDEPLASHLRAIGVRNSRPCLRHPDKVVGNLRITLKTDS